MSDFATDIDRLHDVISGHRRGRQEGRTFAACHHTAGTLETCEPNSLIIWYIPYMAWTHHIIPMLVRVLEEHELDFTWNHARLTLTCNSSRVVFVSVHNQERGRGADYIVEDYGECDEYVEREKIANEIPREKWLMGNWPNMDEIEPEKVRMHERAKELYAKWRNRYYVRD